MVPQPIRVVVAHEHPIFRHGVKLLLENRRGFQIVGQAGDRPSTVDVIRRLKPNILLLGSKLPGGARETLFAITETGFAVRTVVLTSGDEAGQLSFVEWGAHGIVQKHAPVSVLFASIRRVMEGEYWIGRRRLGNSASAMKSVRAARHQNTADSPYGLTPREMQVVAAVANGERNKAIAASLSVQLDTIKHHLLSIFTKVGVCSRLELARFAIDHGLVKDEATLPR